MVYADSSAALAIAKRKGAGKLRHINVSSLWVQEKQDRQEIEYRKVLGTENPADMMTKHLLREALDKCMGHLNQWRLQGRARSGLEVQGKVKTGGGQEKESEVKIGKLEVNTEPSSQTEVTEGIYFPRGQVPEVTEVENDSSVQAVEVCYGYCIEDDWRVKDRAHKVLGAPWQGETQFELSTGGWVPYQHPKWRHALMTPMRVKGLERPEGTQWTGRRRTLVRAWKK